MTTLDYWVRESRGWLARRRAAIWTTIQNRVRTEYKNADVDVPTSDPMWTLDGLVALHIHLRHVLTLLHRTPGARVFAYRGWLQRLLDEHVLDKLPFHEMYQRFRIPEDPSDFEFSSDKLSRVLGKLGVPLEADEIQDMTNRRFDLASGTFVRDDLRQLPCAHADELEQWLAQPLFTPDLDNDPRALASVYHAQHAKPLVAVPDETANFVLRDMKVETILTDKPITNTHFVLLADTLYTRSRLRFWAAQLYYRDPRIWVVLRQLVQPPQSRTIHVAVLLQALLFLHAEYPRNMDAVRDTWAMLCTPNDIKDFQSRIRLPAGVPLAVAVPSPLLASDKWLNVEWANRDAFTKPKQGWPHGAVDPDNDWHFQCVFDCVLAAFHYHLCHKGDYIQEYPNSFPLVLVRSRTAFDRRKNLLDTQTRVQLIVNLSGAMAYKDTPGAVWSDDTWFVLGLLKPDHSVVSKNGNFEEEWSKPALQDRNDLRVTLCSFFRRYIPDDLSQPLPGPGVGAPFTMLPLAGFR